MSVRQVAAIGSMVLLLGSLTATPAVMADDEPEPQTPERALRADLKTMAAANGWTFEQAETDHHAAEVVGRIAGKIAREEPEHFVGSAVGSDADSVPRLYIKGEASDFVRELVAEADIPIEIIDSQPYNFTELEDRSIEVQQVLLALGLEDFAIAVDVAGAGRIPVRVRLTATTPSEAAIREAVPAYLRADVVVTMDQDGNWEPDTDAGSPPLPTSGAPGASPAAGPVAPTEAWGPMAMVRDSLRDTLDQGFGPGTLAIGPTCVTLAGDGWESTLVFRDWQVIWQPTPGAIVLLDGSGGLLTLEDGAEVTLGGYAPWDDDSTGEPPAPPWLVLPGADCPTDLWLVHSATPAE